MLTTVFDMDADTDTDAEADSLLEPAWPQQHPRPAEAEESRMEQEPQQHPRPAEAEESRMEWTVLMPPQSGVYSHIPLLGAARSWPNPDLRLDRDCEPWGGALGGETDDVGVLEYTARYEDVAGSVGNEKMLMPVIGAYTFDPLSADTPVTCLYANADVPVPPQLHHTVACVHRCGPT